MKKVYNIVYGKCTDDVQSLLKAEDEFEEKSRKFDAIWILKMVKTIVYEIDTKIILRVSLHTAMTTFSTMKYYSNEANDVYLTKFKSEVET